MAKDPLRAREFCVCLPCWVCEGGSSPLPTDPDHRPTISRGGDDRSIWPLCHRHHVEIHALGEDTFLARYNLPPGTIEEATAWVAACYLRTFGPIGVFSPYWPAKKKRVEAVRKDVINQYLGRPLD